MGRGSLFAPIMEISPANPPFFGGFLDFDLFKVFYGEMMEIRLSVWNLL